VLSTVGTLAVIAAAITRRRDLWRYAALTFVFSGLGAIPAYITGNQAEHANENLDHELVEQHEQGAAFALGWNIIAGALAVELLRRSRGDKDAPRGLRIALVVVALFASTSSATVGYVGGKLVHGDAHDKAS
jgi:hypothetical protein